jgi:hypothetical protein
MIRSAPLIISAHPTNDAQNFAGFIPADWKKAVVCSIVFIFEYPCPKKIRPKAILIKNGPNMAKSNNCGNKLNIV